MKNQRLWFQYLIESLEELIARTSDKNLHLITVDFYSTDADLRAYLARSKLNYTFLQMKGNFSKVTGLNEGVRHIPDNDSIVFVMDLQLKIPDHIFDQARKVCLEFNNINFYIATTDKKCSLRNVRNVMSVIMPKMKCLKCNVKFFVTQKLRTGMYSNVI